MSGLDRALYASAHDFPGGMEALANLLGRATGTVYNKADPGSENHQFTVKESVALMLASGDYRIAHAICRAIDHAAIGYGDYTQTSDEALLDVYLHCERENGETAAAMHEALDAGRITRVAGEWLDREIAEDIEAKLELRARLRGLRRD